MRLTLKGLLVTSLLGALAVLAGCSADSPTPTSNGGGGGNSGLVLTLSTTNASPIAGNCTVVVASATQNGVPVPAGTSIVLSSTFGVFAQNGLQTISLVTTDGSAVTAICSNTPGPATVTGAITIGSSTAHRTLGLNFLPNGIATLFISICASPHSGTVAGGDAITISGGGFGTSVSAVRVLFRSGAVTHQGVVTAVTDSQISVTTPAFPELAGLPATPVEVDVIVGGQTLSSPNCFTYTTAAQPVVSAILPSSGTKLGGTRVTITGSGFAAPVQVFFGGTLEAEVVSVSSTQIIAITPPSNAQGPTQTFPLDVPVVVKDVNCSGATCTSPPVTFTYTVGMSIFGFTPDHGDASTVVTITGQGFVAPVLVTFSGVQGTVVSVSGTQILAKPPAGCPSAGGTIAVTLLTDGESATAPGTFTVNHPEIVSGPSPASGSGGVSTDVTYIGTDFFPLATPGALSVSATGGTATLKSTSEVNGQQTVVLTIKPDICSSAVTVTFTNTATGCTVSTTDATSFKNSTFIAGGPTATPLLGPIACVGSGNQYTASFSETPSSTGTPSFTYAWTFANADGTPASPASKTGSGGTGTVTFKCPDANPCSGTANLTVTDACGKTASGSLTVTSPGCP